MKILEQIVWLAICIYHEAQGEPGDGKIAVGHVIMNRLRREKKSVRDVILRPQQFSWANGKARPPIVDYLAFIACFQAAGTCLEERMEGKDFFGADHYFATYIPDPEWAQRMKFIAQLGKHRFYKE